MIRHRTYNKHSTYTGTTIFDPMGQATFYWSTMVVGALLYNMWVIPYRYAFDEIDRFNRRKWFALDYTADFIYLLDIAYGFRVGFFKEGVLQHSLSRIKQRHLNETSFYLDCLAVLPLDILYLSVGYNSLLRIFRLVKIIKFCKFVDRSESNMNHPNVFRALVLLHNLLVVFHWNSCFVYCVSSALKFNVLLTLDSRKNVGTNAGLGGCLQLNINQTALKARLSHILDSLLSTNSSDGIINATKSIDTASEFNLSIQDNILLKYIQSSVNDDKELKYSIQNKNLDGTSPTHRPEECCSPYLKSIYWSTLVLTTIGDMPVPQSNGEYILIISQIIFGLIVFAYILGQVSYIISSTRSQNREYQVQMNVIKLYMRKQNVPKKFQNKVCEWFNYSRISKISIQENAILDTLPNKLRAEMAIYVHLDTLKRVEIFQNTEAGFLRQLVLKLKSVLFSPGDYVCLKGEVGKEMYIVNTGILEIIGGQDNHTILLILRAGSYFGEISVLNMGPYGNRRTASVRSVGYSELFSLSKDDLWEVLKEFPNARARLEEIAAKRLTPAKTSNGHVPHKIPFFSSSNDVGSDFFYSESSLRHRIPPSNSAKSLPIEAKDINFLATNLLPDRKLPPRNIKLNLNVEVPKESQTYLSATSPYRHFRSNKSLNSTYENSMTGLELNTFGTANKDGNASWARSNAKSQQKCIPIISISNGSDSENQFEEYGYAGLNSEFDGLIANEPSRESSFLSIKSPEVDLMSPNARIEINKNNLEKNAYTNANNYQKSSENLWERCIMSSIFLSKQPPYQKLTRSLSYPFFGGILQYTGSGKKNTPNNHVASQNGIILV